MMPTDRKRVWAWRLAIVAVILSMIGLVAAFIAVTRQTGQNTDTLKAQCERSNAARAEIVRVFRVFEAEALKNPNLTPAQVAATKRFVDEPLSKLGPKQC